LLLLQLLTLSTVDAADATAHAADAAYAAVIFRIRDYFIYCFRYLSKIEVLKDFSV
jgi:hypothetical protein